MAKNKIAFEEFKEIDSLDSIVSKHKAWLKRYIGKKYGFSSEGKMELRINCLKCKSEFKEGYCKECYLQIQGELLAKVMEGSTQALFSEIRDLCWKLEDRITTLENSIEEIRNSFIQFKIRGFKLKSKKEETNQSVA